MWRPAYRAWQGGSQLVDADRDLQPKDLVGRFISTSGPTQGRDDIPDSDRAGGIGRAEHSHAGGTGSSAQVNARQSAKWHCSPLRLIEKTTIRAPVDGCSSSRAVGAGADGGSEFVGTGSVHHRAGFARHAVEAPD